MITCLPKYSHVIRRSWVTYTFISSDYKESFDAGSPRVIVYRYDGLLMHLVDPPSTDYVSGPEDPEQAPLSPDYIPGPEYPEYLAPSDDEISVEDQDNADDEDEEEASEEDDEEEEHLASIDVLLLGCLSEPAPIPFPSEAEVARLLAIPTPPPSPLTPLLSPLPQIPSPPFHVPLPPTTILTYAEAPLGFRAARIRLRAASPTSLPTHQPLPLHAPSTSRRPDILKGDIPPQKRLWLTTPTSGFEVRESSAAATARQPGLRTARTTDYGFVDMVDDAPIRHAPRKVRYGISDTWHEVVDAIQEGASTTLEGVNARVTKLAETHERDTQDLYAHLEDGQDNRAHLSGRVNMLLEDRQFHQQTVIAHTQIQDLRISSQEALTTTLVAQVSSLQIQLIAALGQIQALQAIDPIHVDDLEDADSENGFKKRIQNHPAIATATATTTTPMTNVAIRALIAQGVADALARRTIQRNTNLNDDGSQGFGSVITRLVPPTRKCTYSDFLKCQPLNFKGTKGVTIGHDVAYIMPWKTLMKMMTTKYCPRNKIKKLEIEIWNLKVKGIDLAIYTQRFQELALMRGRMFPEYSDVVENYVGGLPDMIQGNVMSTKPKTMKEAIEMANNLMDQKLRTLAERQIENKRKQDDDSKNNQNQQQSNKRQNTGRAYTAGPIKKIGAWDCRSSGNANACNNQRATGANQKGTSFYECGAQGQFKRECPKLKNKNHGNQCGNGNAPAKVYVVGNAGTNPDSNIVTGKILLNNRYASILFDTGADRSFVFTAFRSLIDITPTTLYNYYDVEIADKKINGINTIIRGCTLNLLNHPFNIDLKPVELGSFDVIIGNETLIVRGDERNQGNETRLNTISCTKTQKYMLKGCHVFLACVTTKDTEDKSEEKRLEDVPIVRDFPEVFPEDLSSLSPTRQVEFKIDLMPAPGAFRQRLYKTQFLTLGSSGLVFQEEGYIILNVHRLPRTEQANGEESLSTLED
uniref:Reverse transcriptase domain-containing protein n=1 Tax=Tanacetum cinerariifolium TaxID=118510 RepID=A0A6L2KD91_TANCI|nr:hypothetical protein [Tanacetum cinerariifolium]